MTPEAQRVAIAEACSHCVEWHDSLPYWKGEWSAVGEGNERFALFDPPSDLNAMHEVEKVLEYKHETEFIEELRKLVAAGDYDSSLTHSTVWCLLSATAAQRAEAFLRTLGLWQG